MSALSPKADIGGPLPRPLGHDGLHRGSLPVGSLRQLRTHSVQGAVRIHESELSHSVISVARLTETTLDSVSDADAVRAEWASCDLSEWDEHDPKRTGAVVYLYESSARRISPPLSRPSKGGRMHFTFAAIRL